MTLLADGRSVQTQPRRSRLVGPAITLGALTLATAALQARDPHVTGSWGACPSATLFGVWCPGCGGLRAVHDLGHGHLVAAASSNLLLVAAIPVVVFLIARWTYDAWTGTPRPRTWLSSWPVVTLAVVGAVAFTVLRNLPAGAWLAP